MTDGENVLLTVRELSKILTTELENGGIEDAKAEAGFILMHITGESHPILTMGDKPLSKYKAEEAFSICKRRTYGEPLQYILGDWDFFGETFKVGKGVLIPRPDTETLVEEAVRLRKSYSTTKFVDLCSGSGCIAASVARNVKGSEGFALEKSSEAFGYLCTNLRNLAPWIKPCLLDALLPETAEQFTGLDLITANPPYLTAQDMKELQREVTYEPDLALFGGEDGLVFYRELTRIWKGSLKSGGYLIFEVGLGQYKDVMKILKENGFCRIYFVCDLSGIERVVIGQVS